jgi:hypothetical protein
MAGASCYKRKLARGVFRRTRKEIVAIFSGLLNHIGNRKAGVYNTKKINKGNFRNSHELFYVLHVIDLSNVVISPSFPI